MLKSIKRIDGFTKNVILVFLGTSLVNFFNLFYQLLIAHRLSAVDFASFNSILSIYILLSTPLGTLQMVFAKHISELKARGEFSKLKFFFSDISRRMCVFSIVTLILTLPFSFLALKLLKISSPASGFILSVLLALAWLIPVFSGGIQGLQYFNWLSFGSSVTGGAKLFLAFVFIYLGYSIAGALGAFLISNLIGIAIYALPLKEFICAKIKKMEEFGYFDIFNYVVPVAISYLCFMSLVSMEMVLVKYFFSEQDAGIYSLAQMVGKIFLFLPGAISLVMFPKISGLNAKNEDTISTLNKSLIYVLGLCVLALIFYNLFPQLILKVLTGKNYAESALLGRFFAFSMSLFTLVYIYISYFLSIKELKFIKYLVMATVIQFFGITLFHRSLISVQVILCINSFMLLSICILITNKRKKPLNKMAL